MFVLQPVGGLCNRLLAIDSALGLSELQGLSLKIVWEITPAMNCAFSKLFYPIEQINLLERSQSNFLIRQLKKQIHFFSFERFIYHNEYKELWDQNFDFGSLPRYQSLYICAYNRFYNTNRLAQMFIPLDPIMKRIRSYSDSFDENTIGLHIRRTDHHFSKDISTTTKFIAYIEYEIEKNKKCNFYLASDDVNEITFLKKRYGKRIISQDGKRARLNINDTEISVIDLFCLSKTAKIYGTFFSSFSRTAAQLEGAELIIVQ